MRSDASWARWPQIDELFAEALDRPPDERQRFLAAACGDDGELLRILTDLIAASDRAAEELRAPGDQLVRAAFGHPDGGEGEPSRAPGDPIGRYRLTRPLGRGGMATVYEAERADGTYAQRVAIKLLRWDVERSDLARRFHVETQILSTLAHPNIARLLDAGTTPDGQPFLVMELVEGESITDWANRQRLTVDRRLDLFSQVADAVSFAHRHLVVHRDIKPSNVLVDRDGQVKLVDFGIAKLLEPDRVTERETRPTTRWMTPGYASPEQILGRPVTTATDVHGLGVLLYELLAGRRPFGGDGVSGFDLDKAICEQTPTCPSSIVGGVTGVAEARRTNIERLRRRLTGDLDAIVSKALRKEPDERYASAQAMMKDIERHRTGFPVEARQGLRSYTARKFVSRHRLGVSAAAAIVVILAGSSFMLWRQQLSTAEARDQVSIEAENAGLVIDFLADVFRGRNPEQAPSDTLTARDLLAWGSERVDAEFADRPVLQAELLAVLGSAYRNLGLFDEAIEHMTRAVERSRTAHGDRSDEVARRLTQLSGVYRSEREWDPAITHAQEALEIRRATLDRADPGLVESVLALARARIGLGQPDSAEPLLREAIDVMRRDPTADERLYALALIDLAQARRVQEAYEEAARLYEEAIPKLRALNAGRSELIVPINNHAFLLRTMGDYVEAEALYREALEISAEVYGRGHPGTLMVANNLASVLHEQDDADGVAAVLRDNVTAASAQWPDGHWRVGVAHASLGRALLRFRRWDEAFAALREAHEVYNRTIGADHLWTYFVEAALAAGYLASGQAERGQPYLDRFYQQRAEHPPDASNAGAVQDFNGHIEALVFILEDLDLDREAERFRTLIQSQ